MSKFVYYQGHTEADLPRFGSIELIPKQTNQLDRGRFNLNRVIKITLVIRK